MPLNAVVENAIMNSRLLSIALVIFGANLFGLGYVSSNGASADMTLMSVLGISVLLSVAIAVNVIASLLTKKKEKEKKKEAKEENIRQSVVIPVKAGKVCMVSSSSDGKKMVFPKGRIEKGESAGETAVREVWEEAGLLGSLQTLFGSYLYEKDGKKHFVVVFRMSIVEEGEVWPESAKRDRCWLNPSEAAEQLPERDAYLRKILLSLEWDDMIPSSETSEAVLQQIDEENP